MNDPRVRNDELARIAADLWPSVPRDLARELLDARARIEQLETELAALYRLTPQRRT